MPTKRMAAYAAECSRSGGEFSRRAIRPTEESKRPDCYVRNASTPAVAFAQTLDIRRRVGERVKSTRSGPSQLPRNARSPPESCRRVRKPSARRDRPETSCDPSLRPKTHLRYWGSLTLISPFAIPGSTRPQVGCAMSHHHVGG